MPSKNRHFPSEGDIYFAKKDVEEARSALDSERSVAAALALDLYRSYESGALEIADKQTRKLTSVGMNLVRCRVKLQGAVTWLSKLETMRAKRDAEEDPA